MEADNRRLVIDKIKSIDDDFEDLIEEKELINLFGSYFLFLSRVGNNLPSISLIYVPPMQWSSSCACFPNGNWNNRYKAINYKEQAIDCCYQFSG